ncbi:hypothetical protein A2714_01950 [Candidatus Woesebacteria bacterium RIFCSPHIGHO2_01_FULL_38_9]|uniref:OmpR/PhoB-type domain-containing protein n=2 Tax=Candidatus Woeseibacteriota TaxID=1752722 RepID=A0A1F7Y190_9BACT|nr:MAG: hypothetical protein A2714_01950 [Candidatus Woesebacteria bacterium RIFCSPHIGHO2_01_FULL_38_9]OGM60162.1 MAG: hypothetical protein A3A75_05675 [Candidatus Woesebacteria bacterium RIFCSPLOWO2_01_FULL_39_10]
MNKSYFELLPRDYFDGLYEKVMKDLKKGDNVCVSAIYGTGNRTFLNLFFRFAEEDKIFDKIVYFDPQRNLDNLASFVKGVKTKNRFQKILVVIRLFEKISNKRDVLEKLNSLRQPEPERLTFLVLADHTVVTEPENYLAETATFFNSHIYIRPFNKKESIAMMEITNNFFGWKVNENLYDEIYELSGGIGRLLKYICKETSEGKLDFKRPEVFLEIPQINFQVEYLTRILFNYNNETLKKLGLLNEEEKIRSKLLYLYAKYYRPVLIKELFPTLSNLEQQVLGLLYELKGKCVSIDQIGDIFERLDREFSPWAIYKLISRLKPKVKNNFEILSIKGKGYYLRSVS